MFVPAERTIVSVRENRPSLFSGQPDFFKVFFDEIMNAKHYYKDGYDMPFGQLRFEYNPQCDISWVAGPGYEVRVTDASSGIQSALPLCLVTDYLAQKVNDKENKRSVPNYDSFINIVEEPELNLFPKSQIGVLFTLVRACRSSPKNTLIISTHSPYTLAIINLMIMAGKISTLENNVIKCKWGEFKGLECCLQKDEIAAYRLSLTEEVYCKSIISDNTGLISKNDLDSSSEEIMSIYNNLYRLYAESKDL